MLRCLAVFFFIYSTHYIYIYTPTHTPLLISDRLISQNKIVVFYFFFYLSLSKLKTYKNKIMLAVCRSVVHSVASVQ